MRICSERETDVEILWIERGGGAHFMGAMRIAQCRIYMQMQWERYLQAKPRSFDMCRSATVVLLLDWVFLSFMVFPRTSIYEIFIQVS